MDGYDSDNPYKYDESSDDYSDDNSDDNLDDNLDELKTINSCLDLLKKTNDINIIQNKNIKFDKLIFYYIKKYVKFNDIIETKIFINKNKYSLDVLIYTTNEYIDHNLTLYGFFIKYNYFICTKDYIYFIKSFDFKIFFEILYENIFDIKELKYLIKFMHNINTYYA